MRIRHRTPSIFSLSMVDVFCCALGSVLLLWLWNLRKAQDFQIQTEQQTQQAAALLAGVTEDRDGAYRLLLELQGSLDETQRARNALDKDLATQRTRILTLETQLDDAAKRQALTSKDLEGLRALLDRERTRAGDLDREKVTLQDRLRALQALADRLPALEKELAAARALEKDAATALRLRDADLAAARSKEKQSGELLRTRDADLLDLSRRVQLLTTDKATLAKNLAALEKTMSALNSDKSTLEKTLSTHASNLTTSQTRVRDLEKEVAAQIRTLLNLQDEKKALEAKFAKMKASTESRFAGIELTGKRVVFIVDTSLSMIETADGKPFPEKYTTVIDTVGRVMKSLPDLESYQLVIFSREASFPLGQPGEWLRFDPASSPDLVMRTLRDPKYKPDGGTNMYAGLEAAFRLRASHLDTVYLFSDGLPSRGVGVDPVVARSLSDSELARRLGDHVRLTLRQNWNRIIPNLPTVRIHSVGFYYDSPDVGAFLWSLSRENQGSFVGMSRP